jgi:hypothetical protein
MEDMMTDTHDIRRRRDGSIDTEHYLACALDRRSAAAHAIAGRGGRRFRDQRTALRALFASFRAMGRQG